MNEESDAQLLRAYADQRNEETFREIVVRYTDLVYSAALRQVGSPDPARDVAQSVFNNSCALNPRSPWMKWTCSDPRSPSTPRIKNALTVLDTSCNRPRIF